MSPLHWIVIGVVALLLFGNRLPEVARSIGRAINEFKKGMREVNDELNENDPLPPPASREKLRPPAERPSDTVARGAAAPRAEVEEEDLEQPR